MHQNLIRLSVTSVIAVTVSSYSAPMPSEPIFTNSLGMVFVHVKPGDFTMGFEGGVLPKEVLDFRDKERRKSPIWVPETGDYDEIPTHKVRISRPFYLAMYEVTNRQYEEFDRLHAHLRGKLGFSIDRDEAVVFVSWQEARAFCDWLSKKEGLPYRLPTEAEWEYAARAGTTTRFSTGDTLPAEFIQNPDNSWYPNPYRSRGREEVVPLHVGRTPANPWGLFDMHGNVEEWCFDWYGPYTAGDKVDPVGRSEGDFKVSRGGSHSTVPFYMRSANRMGTLPESRSWYIGFRVVLGELPKTPGIPPEPPVAHQLGVSQHSPPEALQGPDPERPFFTGPQPYVKIEPGARGPLFDKHNHDPSLAECPNGDLLAIWYTTVTEPGREVAVAASRLRRGKTEWERASAFWDTPDRNDHCPRLWYDGQQTLYHFNSLAAAASWGALAIIQRVSTDNGVSWSRARMIVPEYQGRNQLVPSIFRTRDGEWVLATDASPHGSGGSALHISRDGGRSWFDPGGTIAGIHAGVAQLDDGRLIAFGRGDTIEGQIPKSISRDLGRSWTYSTSGFPQIGGGQRVALLRLREGPLFLASFAPGGDVVPVYVTDASGTKRRIEGLFGALSYDGGVTWRHARLISDDGPGRQANYSDGRPFTLSGIQGEPAGYLAATQARSGLIHLISSWNHYAFNPKWLASTPPVVEASR